MWWAVVIPLKVAMTLPPGLLPQQFTTLEIPMEFVTQQGHQTDFLGRSDYAGQYHSESYGFASETKQTERERVLDFILSFAFSHDSIHCLSLPGIDWTFERMLLKRNPRSQFVGLEHSYSAYMRSRRSIPGTNQAYGLMGGVGCLSQEQAALSDRQFTFGSADYVYSRRSAISESTSRLNRANRLLFMKADVYMTMLCSDFGATFSEKKAFNQKFFRRNVVWLDFTSQFCKGVQTCVENLHFCLMPSDQAKPVVITMMNGRDGVRGVDARIRQVLDCQPGLTLADHWTYTGKNGTSMLTMCCSMV